MRNTNTKPWWNEFDRRFMFMDRSLLSTSGETTSPETFEGREVYYFLDWDAREDYYVIRPCDYLADYNFAKREDETRGILKRYLDIVAPSIRVIEIDYSERLVAVSSDPAELIGFRKCGIDGLNAAISTFAPQRLEDVTVHGDIQTVGRSHLVEIDRLSPTVDLMKDTSRNGERIVAKWFLAEAHPQWQEFHTIQCLPSHPHLLPIHRIILDDDSGRVVGWASKKVDGTDLEMDKSRFKMKWLKQLLETVDYLHLDLGICHGDLQLKNIMVETATDKILLIDFEATTEISESPEMLQEELNQVIWSVYEIVTHDFALVEERLYTTPTDEDGRPTVLDRHDNNTSIIDDMAEWPVRTDLDCDGKELRKYLKDWADRRRAMGTPTPKTPLELPHVWCPEPSLTTEQDYAAREARFKEIQKHQKTWLAERSSQTYNAIRWERSPYATAYPGRAKRITESTTPAETMLKEREATIPTPKKRAAEPDDEEGSSPAKRARRSLTPSLDEEERCICCLLGDARDGCKVQEFFRDDPSAEPIDVVVSVFGRECPVHEDEWITRFSGECCGFEDQLLGPCEVLPLETAPRFYGVGA